MAIATAVTVLIDLAEQASARAAEARAVAPKPRRLKIPEGQERTNLLIASSMEDQERAAWALACKIACDEIGDAETMARIYPHAVLMDSPCGTQWVQQPGMATQHLRDHVQRIVSAQEQ